jgi:DNA polymerase I-like protein with 3'-5' exonuclease and polymerase domains
MSERIGEFYKKVRKGKSLNINLPALARRDLPFMRCFESDPGYTFVSQDVVSLEPSVTAHFSQDKNYRWATVDGIGKPPFLKDGVLMISDIYLMTASVLPPTRDAIMEAWKNNGFANWVADDEAVKKALKKPRSFAKTAALGLGYGMGAKKLQNSCAEAGFPITFKEAKEVKRMYWALYSGLNQFKEVLEFRAEKEGFIINPFWYRITPEPHKAFNAYIQSTASGVLDLYLMLLMNYYPELHLVAIIHDELVYQCPDHMIKDLPAMTDKVSSELNNMLQWSVPIRFGTVTCKTFEEFK